jgi:glyoxylase-like metal-dependent hydrolase (beta-lactamase superfamily II)
VEEIKENIFVETEFLGCNPSFVVTKEGVVMIDTPQRPDEALRWKSEIQKFGNISCIINTDHHQDHALGNFYFEGDVITHEGTTKRLLAEGRADFCRQWIARIDPQFGPVVENYSIRRPKFSYSERLSLCLGDDLFELIHVESHTQDETLVYMPREKVLFAGDTVCTKQIPSMHESYPLSWLKALDFVETLVFDVLVPGHGKIGDKESFREFRREFSEMINRAWEKIEKGCSREEIIRDMQYEDTVHRRYPPSFAEHFANNMRRNIGRLYDELINAKTLKPKA